MKCRAGAVCRAWSGQRAIVRRHPLGRTIFYSLESRWADNDIYGHINNVAYYAYFDSVVNRFLIEEGGLRPGIDTVVGYVVHSSADYFSPPVIPRR